jgi:multidrug resistance efflux pump
LLEAGPRHEEVREQRQRVERARSWRDLAKQDLTRGKQALTEELARLDQQIAQHHAEREAARDAWERARMLVSKSAISVAEVREAEKKHQVSHAQLEQAQAEKRARQAKGALEAEAELARREKELAEAEGALTLLEAGSRAEDIDAARAHLARLQEEARYLEGLQQKVLLHSPVPAIITTPRLKEKVGQYVREGDLICAVEESASLEAEIALAEQDVARVQPGQRIELKARSLPFGTFQAQVVRIAPAAGRGDVQSTVTVYCRLDDCPAELRPGMTGHARVYTDRRPVGAILGERVLRFLRTEFWW